MRLSKKEIQVILRVAKEIYGEEQTACRFRDFFFNRKCFTALILPMG